MNGDGRLEVVVMTRRSAVLLDALTGAIRWRLPNDAFDTEVPVRLSQLIIADLTGDQIDDLYVTDGGCNDEGSGRGAAFSFADGFNGARISVVSGPRVNGRCGRWQSIGDLTGDGLRELVITDGRGINGFDPRTGERIVCGTRPDAPPNGPLPHLQTPDGTFVVFLPDRIVAQHVIPNDGADDTCIAPFLFSTIFETPPVHELRAQGSHVVSVPAVGPTAIMTTTRLDADANWAVTLLGRDGRINLSDGAVLLGAYTSDNGLTHALIRVGTLRELQGGDGVCRLLTINGDGELTNEEILGGCEPLYDPHPTNRSANLRSLKTTVADGLTVPIVRLYDANAIVDQPTSILQAAPRGLSYRDQRGVSALKVVDGVAQDGVQTIKLVYASTDGRLGVLDDQYNLTRSSPFDGGPALYQASGLGRVAATTTSPPGFLTLSSSGALSGFTFTRNRFERTWVRQIGQPKRGAHGLQVVNHGENDTVVVRNPSLDDDTVSGLDPVTGVTLWSDSSEAEGLQTMRVHRSSFREAAQRALTIRYDRLRVGASLALDASCDIQNISGDLDLDPDPRCPNAPILPRVVTALDSQTGACVWQTALQATQSCSGPSAQTLSLSSQNVFVTESTGLVSLDIDTGRLVERVDLGQLEGSTTGRGGGVVLSGADDALYRIGGNGPPERRTSTLELVWRAERIAGLRAQSWIRRIGLLVGDSLWISPGAGWPIYAYNTATGALTSRFGLLDGQGIPNPEPAAIYGDVQGMTRIQNIDGENNPGVLITTDDGILYAVRDDLTVAWSKQYDSSIGNPSILSNQSDAPLRLAIPTGRGYIDVLGPAGPTPPSLVWDLECPLSEICDEAQDIDIGDNEKTVCGRWSPVIGVDGYRYRLIGTGSAPLTEWEDVGLDTQFTRVIDTLRFGAQYRIQVKSYVMGASGVLESTPAASDGVKLINREAPTATVRVSAAELDSTAPIRATFELTALDDDTLVGWRFDIVSAENGEHIVRLGGGPLDQPEFAFTLDWFGIDQFGRAVMPGLYRAEFSVYDRSGNEGSVSSEILEICEGVCP